MCSFRTGERTNEATGPVRGDGVSRSELDADAGRERHRPARALVVDRLEPGADEIVDLRHAGHVAQSKLREDLELRPDVEEHADVPPERERRRPVVEVRRAAGQVRRRRREDDVGLVDEGETDRALAVAPDRLGQRQVLPVAEVHAEALIVIVLPVQPRDAEIAHRRQVGVERLERERDAHFGVVVEHVAAAEVEVETRAVDVRVGILEDDGGLAVERPDRARVDVSADPVVPPDPEVDAPAPIGRLRPRQRGQSDSQHEHGTHDVSTHRFLPPRPAWRACPDSRSAAPAHFNTPASSFPTFAPPDFVTKLVSTGTAFDTSPGSRPSLENALAADARPAIFPIMPDVPVAPLAAGAALSNRSMPGTADETVEKSLAARRDLATPRSAPAAPAACSGVLPISLASELTRSGLALAAADAASVAAGAFFSPLGSVCGVCAYAGPPTVSTSAMYARPRPLLPLMVTSSY